MKGIAIARAGAIAAAGASGPTYNPLSLPWAKAYWTEGPEFVALGYANGAAVTVFPDEKGTDDLNATTSAFPLFNAVNARMNNKPTVSVASGKQIQRLFGSAVPAVHELVLIGTITINGTWPFGNNINMLGGVSGQVNNTYVVLNAVDSGSPRQKYVLSTNGSTGENTGASVADVNPHIWRMNRTGNPILFYEDEVQVISLAAGVNGTYGCISLPGSTDGFSVAFLGIIARALTAQERIDLHTWAQSHYGAS